MENIIWDKKDWERELGEKTGKEISQMTDSEKLDEILLLLNRIDRALAYLNGKPQDN